jgi:hypothetical protein
MDEIENYSIIGTGTFGTVIHPGILCSQMSNDKEHYVSKILPIKQAEKEITLLNEMLPKELDGILYFTENSYCKIDETNKQILEKLGINSKDKACVNMVYLPGLELNDYLEQYKTEENQTNQWHDKYEMRDEIPEIPREVILELLMKLSKFYPKVISLNNDYHYYHNDISTGNIMYSRNEYYLIDFGRSSNKPNAPNFDILTVIDVFNTILSSIQYMTNNEDLKLIYKTYNNELDAFNKIRPRQPPAEMFEFKKTLFEKTLNEFIKIQNPSINEISGGKKNKTKKNKTKRKRHKKRHTKKHR